MNKILILIAVIALFVFMRRRKQSGFNKNVISTSSDTVVEDSNGETVFIVYAPWCGHCKESMKDFKEAVSQSGGKIKLVNGDEYPEFVSKYNIKGFPTIMKTNGKELKGHRDTDSILEFAGIKS